MKKLNWLIFKQGVNNLVIRGCNIEDKWTNVLTNKKVTVGESFPFKNLNRSFILPLVKVCLSEGIKMNY